MNDDTLHPKLEQLTRNDPESHLAFKRDLKEHLVQFFEESPESLINWVTSDTFVQLVLQAVCECIDLSHKKESQIDLPTSPLLNTKEAAEYLGMAPRTLAEYANRGEIRSIKIPHNSRRGEWRFRMDDINQWLDKGIHQKRKPASPNIWEAA